MTIVQLRRCLSPHPLKQKLPRLPQRGPHHISDINRQTINEQKNKMKIDRIYRFFAAVLAAVALCSCDGFIYEEQGDCDPYYKVRFHFDRNLKFTDAFHAEVGAVTLYLVDEATGRIVWSKHEAGDAVRSQDYLMDVPVAPGRYHLVAWCGEGVGEDFEVASTDRHEGLVCSLVHDSFARGADGDYHVTRHLKGLYHGTTLSQEFPDEEGVHIYDVSLTKDTNEVNVVLQQLSGGPVDKNKFSFYITDANHVLDHTNAIAVPDGETITYHAHYTSGGSADIEVPEQGVTSLGACVAGLSVSRLVKGQPCWLCVENNETGKLVFRVPLIDYALLVKGYEAKDLDDQEYLDRQDKYDMVFFLDEGYRWMNAYIYINTWKIVLQNIEL